MNRCKPEFAKNALQEQLNQFAKDIISNIFSTHHKVSCDTIRDYHLHKILNISNQYININQSHDEAKH